MRLIPGKEGRSVKPGVFDVSVKVNSAGFRDREHVVANPAGIRRIALLGDSFLEAIQVPFEHSITSLLQDRMPDREFLNFGVSGTGTARQYLALRHYALPYKPDVVALFFFAGNDISDNSRRLQGRPYVPYPIFTPTGRLALHASGEPIFSPFSDQSSRLSSVTGILKDYWKSYRLVRELVDKSPAVHRALYRAKLASTPQEAISSPAGDHFGFYEIYRPELRKDWNEAWVVTQDLLLATRDLAISHGAEFFVVLIPAAWEACPEHWESILKKFPAMRDASLDTERPLTRFSMFLEANGVPFLNLLPAFRKDADKCQSLYVHDDAHWTSAGHALATELVAPRFARLTERRMSEVHAEDGTTRK